MRGKQILASPTYIPAQANLLLVAVLHIKGFPEDLQRRLRLAAVARDATVKALVERAVARLLDQLDVEDRRDR